ncbi:MAG TPA: hypothetical protein DHW42_11370 [Candidatus Marinimicrobia bacterium]|nr:hypothetical protein [Candidatus Neomarinimicrobiota bacterium]
MSILYFANVGNRDVKHSEVNQVIPRLSGKEWLDDYDNKKTKLDFPILSNGLKYVLENLDGRSIDKLFLFYTDQKEGVAEKHRQSDTLYFAELMKQMIIDRMAQKVATIDLIRIEGTPNNYDDMFHFYSEKLEIFKHQEKAEIAFFAPAGGTPACNMNMVLHGSRVFGQKSRVVLISETPGSKPKSLNISSEIIHSHNRKAIEKMAEHYNFNGIANLLRLSVNPKDRALMNLALYGSSRLSLDFQGALNYLNQIDDPQLINEPIINDLRQSANSFTQSVPALHSGVDEQSKKEYLLMQKRQICEVCLCAIIKYKTGQYTDCMGRIFRIQESLARWFFEYYTGYYKKFQYKKDFNNFGETEIGRDFKNYMNSKQRKSYRFEPNRVILTKFWSWVTKTNPKQIQELYPELHNFVKRVDTLSDLRNESPIAHGFASVTESVISEKFRGNLLEDLNRLPERFQFQWNLKAYDQIIDLICQYY